MLLTLQIGLTLVVITWTLWRRDTFLYFMSSPVAVIFGLVWRGYNDTLEGYVLSWAFIGFGIYAGILGIYNLVNNLRKLF